MGDASLPSQPQPSQPILPTVVVPSPPAILTNPAAEDNDEELELPHFEQEETTHPVQTVHQRSRKLGRGRNQVRIKIHLDRLPEMNLHLHPISIRTIQPTCRCHPTVMKNSSLTFPLHPALEVQRTTQHTDQEDGEPEDSQRWSGSRSCSR